MSRIAGAGEEMRGQIAMPILAPLRAYTTLAEVEQLHPGTELVHVCDFYVTGAERGARVPGGLRLGRILNVDHHAPTPEMEREITSTMLAAEYLSAGAVAGPDTCVVIHHTDCDSVLSSAMLLGLVPPDPDLVHASLCADHTGAAHPVADLLQAIDEGRGGTRTREQYLASIRALEVLRAGGEPDEAALIALRRRKERRVAAKSLVDAGRFDVDGDGLLAFAESDGSIDSAFFPALVRGVAVIMVAHRRNDRRWTVKLRLGDARVPGLTLHALRMAKCDPHYGGRWNAGSNGRGGGTAVPPRDYADSLRARLVELVRTS